MSDFSLSASMCESVGRASHDANVTYMKPNVARPIKPPTPISSAHSFQPLSHLPDAAKRPRTTLTRQAQLMIFTLGNRLNHLKLGFRSKKHRLA